MSDLKVDFLVRDELQYELKCRDVTFQEKETVDVLRKLLRKAIKDNVTYSVNNLKTKLKLESELDLIKSKCEAIKSTSEDLSSESRIQDIIRIENKIFHTRSRVENLLRFQLKEESTHELKGCLDVLNKSQELVSNLNVKTDLKENYVRRVSENNEEEENLNSRLDDVFLEKSSVSKIQEQISLPGVNNPEHVSELNLAHTSRPNLQNTLTQNKQENPPFDMSLYNKLSNPLEKYLSGIKITNGLNIEELLSLMKIMFKIKREVKLADSQIINLLVNHCNDPLLNTLLQSKERNLSLTETNRSILENFIPHNMLENMRMHSVNRPQRDNEAFSLYILEVRENAEILMCNYSEAEIVNIIKTGLNFETRSKLTFCADPKSFSELNSLCITFNNVNYSDFCRAKQGPALNRPPTEIHQRKPVSCYNCGGVGHIAKNCFKRTEGRSSVKPHSKN